MNKYQKLVVQATRIYKKEYENLWNEYLTFRWHRCQTRMFIKDDKLNTIDSLRKDIKYLRTTEKYNE